MLTCITGIFAATQQTISAAAYGLFRCRTTAAACFFNNKNLAGTNQTNFVIVSINSPSKEGN